ncbi:unnamed protein product [Fraxinus pennsylvanica]|uniref:Uncharacterized protein n=1 Tax=Fraxinus pennsylvanica TaxID=56036 RepID=A0AAD2DYQ7_9LAMI|nr:unnamed protein product [Fraxinus pennsylvanica]
MAKTSSFSSEISTTFTHPFLLFLGLVFIFLVLVNSSDPSKHSMDSSLPSRRLLLNSDSAAKSTNFHPRKREKHSHGSSYSKREFEAGDHEVPSGPNPISNK